MRRVMRHNSNVKITLETLSTLKRPSNLISEVCQNEVMHFEVLGMRLCTFYKGFVTDTQE